MRKYIIYLTTISLFGCVKDLEEIVPNGQNIIHKNYLLPSYDLQKSDVHLDIMELRKNKTGVNSGWNILPVAFIDVNRDGNDDIFYVPSYGTTNTTDGQLFLYKNGDYVLDNSYFTTVPSLVAARKVIVGDFNNDKIPDMFIAATGDDNPPFAGEFCVLLISNTNKKYDLVKFVDKIGFYHGVCSGDIDKDGDLDIFVLGKTNSYFLINDGRGNFTYSTNQFDLDSLIEQYTCELVDIDKDGFLDLVVGGHEFMSGNTTRVYWGNSLLKYTTSNMSNIPTIPTWGTIVDIDFFDLDNDGNNEMVVTRTGGTINNFTNFYSGWYIQILKNSSRTLSDVTSNFISDYTYTPKTTNNQEWIPWMRFEDYDDDGKIDFFSTRCTPSPFVRWEWEPNEKKLVKIN